ncbi:T9SS type A sorting domain-containing protein [Paraflavitalea speifideaquila]|uniref:T9SS type A sorting domain-containing protein n=1 Tax=Paraflavitalea speifideaquila TaxID=3076558 RepID=UPI0028EB666E|nr:T9SS type A sorting domain-containing protein [Paraflavitalea speifideiaquila]
MVIDDGAVIPPNSSVVIFMSNNITITYNFTSWCTQFGTVYILYRNLVSPTTPTFLNTSASPEQRTASLSINGVPACNAAFKYNVPTTSTEGNFYQFPTPTAGVSISPGSVNNGCASPPFSVLPISLKSFTATLANEAVQIQWTTSTEQQTDYFEVQRSSNGSQFISLGKVVAAGNSNSDLTYSYKDPGKITAPAYYRLLTVDMDGTKEYSKVVRVKPGISAFELIEVSPNPAISELVVAWNAVSAGSTTVMIGDLSGRVVYTRNLGGVAGYNRIRLPISVLLPGLYQLRLQSDQHTASRKFIKQ